MSKLIWAKKRNGKCMNNADAGNGTNDDNGDDDFVCTQLNNFMIAWQLGRDIYILGALHIYIYA